MVMLKELFDNAKKNIEQPRRKRRVNSKKTGVRNVFIINCPRCKSGFMFQYRFMNDDGERKTIQSVNFNRLKSKVNDMNMEWIVDDEPMLRKTLNKFKGDI